MKRESGLRNVVTGIEQDVKITCTLKGICGSKKFATDFDPEKDCIDCKHNLEYDGKYNFKPLVENTIGNE